MTIMCIIPLCSPKHIKDWHQWCIESRNSESRYTFVSNSLCSNDTVKIVWVVTCRNSVKEPGGICTSLVHMQTRDKSPRKRPWPSTNICSQSCNQWFPPCGHPKRRATNISIMLIGESSVWHTRRQSLVGLAYHTIKPASTPLCPWTWPVGKYSVSTLTTI